MLQRQWLHCQYPTLIQIHNFNPGLKTTPIAYSNPKPDIKTNSNPNPIPISVTIKLLAQFRLSIYVRALNSFQHKCVYYNAQSTHDSLWGATLSSHYHKTLYFMLFFIYTYIFFKACLKKALGSTLYHFPMLSWRFPFLRHNVSNDVLIAIGMVKKCLIDWLFGSWWVITLLCF